MNALQTQSTAEESRWQALLARDERAGAFVYAVRTTGVYCRIGCASKRPRREHVRFFDAPREAEHAGFRACRRCRPEQPNLFDGDEAVVRRALDVLSRQNGEPLPLAPWARQTGVPPACLRRAFRRVLGVTPRQYRDQRRVAALKERLRAGRSVTESLYEAGYGSGSRLYEGAGERLGMTPRAYGRGGAGVRIGYRTVASPVGRLLVAATERGVCFVALGESDAELEGALRAEYPAASLRRGGAGMAAWVRAIAAHLRGGAPIGDLPTDVRATAFQRRVWDELRAIPLGATRSYGEIARRLSRPRAARAVARACATNPLAIVVPCHRVVGGDGAAGGYRYGPTRKRQLLRREAARVRSAR